MVKLCSVAPRTLIELIVDLWKMEIFHSQWVDKKRTIYRILTGNQSDFPMKIMGFVWVDLRGNLNRKPIRFYHEENMGFSCNVSQKPSNWSSDPSTAQRGGTTWWFSPIQHGDFPVRYVNVKTRGYVWKHSLENPGNI